MNVYLESQRIALDPAAAIGQGGEAEVFDIGGGQALKIFKGPQHPDFGGSPHERDAAGRRLALHQRKLPDFPAGLPERVIAPATLATERKRGGRIVGYAMRLVAGAELLARYAEPQMRRHRHGQAQGQAAPGNQAVAVLRDLHATVCALHRAGVIIGDFNDSNVLVSGQRAYLIDADSFQFDAYPCTVFTERFVDPLLCDPAAAAPVLCRPYSDDSDWYAFHVLTMRTLLGVGPYGGVHRPADPARRIPQAARPLHRVTVFDREVVYPRPALPYDLLPDALLARLEDVFCRDRRGPLPPALLDDLRFTRCLGCGAEHARDLCPRCRPGVARPAAVHAHIQGRLRVEQLAVVAGAIIDARLFDGVLAYLGLDAGQLRDHTGAVLATALHLRPGRTIACWPGGALVADAGHARVLVRPGAATPAPHDIDSDPGIAPSIAVDTCAGETALAVSPNGRHVAWASGGRLLCWRGSSALAGATGVRGLGPTDLGSVLRGQTRLWLGDALGFGFYRAGALGVGFLFDPERRGLNDRVELPPMRGRIEQISCAVGRDRVWLFWREHRQGKEIARCALIAASGALLAMAEADADGSPNGNGNDDDAWLLAGAGATALGPYLFAPTDAGIVRVEAHGNALRPTRGFSDTQPFVSAGDRLMSSTSGPAGASGLYVVKPDRILRLTLS
jgi:hypothetical protein